MSTATAAFAVVPKVILPEKKILLAGKTYYSALSIADLLGVSIWAVHKRANEGLLPFITQPGLLSKKRLFTEPGLIAFLESL
jgi:hypothetical protein